MALPLAALLGGASIASSALGGEQARETSLEGAKAQSEIEGQKREFDKEQFGKQIARQQPFLDVGSEALPRFIEAISNRGDASQLPATQIQGDLISEFLGAEAPQFIKDRALSNLTAVEAERNKGRLADLVSAGLGGTLSAAGSRVDLGTQTGQSLGRQANILGQGLQESAINRQNTIGQTVGGLAGLPALIAAQRGPSSPSDLNFSGFTGDIERGAGGR